jgi:hypothetical protein
MTATATYKNASAHRDAIMNANPTMPMAQVVELMAKEIMVKGKPMGAARAKAYYVDAVKTGRCPGKIEVAPKAPKTPKVPKAKALKVPTDRKAVLKAAAKKAGIHKDTVAEVTGSDDPLNLSAPESLTADDLKVIL